MIPQKIITIHALKKKLAPAEGMSIIAKQPIAILHRKRYFE